MAINPFFILIFLTGILTSNTDLLHKQIKNHQLILVACLAIIVYVWTFWTQNTIPKMQLLSLLCSSVIAVLFFWKKLWRPGDAKLFMLYSFLMPSTGYETSTSLPLPCFFLFANSFIFGLILQTPEFIKIVFRKHKEILLELFSRETVKDLSRTILVTFGLSWILFPILTRLNISQYGFVSFLIVFFALKFFFDVIKDSIRNTAIFIAAVVAGTFIRFLLFPEFFEWRQLSTYVQMLLLYSLCGLGLHNFTRYIANVKDRVPFAPILAVGCLLSYTPFLIWLIPIVTRR